MSATDKNLLSQITSLKNQLEEEKKKYKSEIDKLEKIIQTKNQEIEKKEKKEKKEIQNPYDLAEDNSTIIKEQLEATQKLNMAFQEDILNKVNEIENYKKEITNLKKEISDLKQQIETLKEKIKISNNQYESLKNQFDVVKKQKDVLKEREEKIKSDIELKNKEIEELKITIKKLEDNNNDMLKYVKDVQEKEEEKIKKEIELRLQKEKELQEKMNAINKIKQDNETKDMDQEEKDKFLTDILCEFLLKLNNSQYFISVFELLDNCLKHYDELKFFKKMESYYGCPLNHTLYNFFGSFSSYISISSENVSLSDFLSQKFFKYSEINKNDVELIKRISSIKISKDIKILDLYRKKKEIFLKSLNLTFDLLKNKIINDEDNKKMNMLNDKPDFLQITKPPKELTINFNEINIYKFSSLVDYQIYNILPKLEITQIRKIKNNYIRCLFIHIIFTCIKLQKIKFVRNYINQRFF